MVFYLVGQRGLSWAKAFMEDVALRINSRVQITTDGHRAYVEAIEGVLGMDVDYAALIKLYGTATNADTGYSPGEFIGAESGTLPEDPILSTSAHRM